jgi:hypothetical protein
MQNTMWRSLRIQLNRLFYYFFEGFLNYIGVKKPIIIYFMADRTFRHNSEGTVLRWYVRHVSTVEINGRIYPSKGQIYIQEIKTQRYHLSATNRLGTSTAMTETINNPRHTRKPGFTISFPERIFELREYALTWKQTISIQENRVIPPAYELQLPDGQFSFENRFYIKRESTLGINSGAMEEAWREQIEANNQS